MPRQLVSRAELTRVLTERMQQLPNGKDCSLGGVLRLPRARQRRMQLDAGVANNCRSALNDVVAKARLEFNLEEE